MLLLFEVLFLILWIGIQGFILWLIIKEKKQETPVTYGGVACERPARMSTDDEPNFYNQTR